MIQEKVKILWNTLECSGYFRMGLGSAAGYEEAKPGQFVMIRLPDSLSPLLRRPFSIHRLIRSDGHTDGVEILYKVVGQGTEKLSALRKGEGLDILGPLGNHFTVAPGARRFFIVAGGIGVAPMFFLTDFLRCQGMNLSESRFFIGGRSKDDLLCMNDFFSVGVHTLQITTDDGSAGDRELVTGPLERAVKEDPPDMIYACGPIPMLKTVARIAGHYRIPCQVSIETLMACGMGACLGCAVAPNNSSAPYLHACKDGPVFDVRDIVL
jgi:dihydroorotate dehydrogenase electron transfer subunit